VNPFYVVAILLIGIAVGALVAMLVLRQIFEARTAQGVATATGDAKAAESRASDLAARLTATEVELRSRSEEIRSLSAQLASLTAEKEASETQLQAVIRLHDQMKEAFASLSAQALQATSTNFFQVAKRELESARVDQKRDLDQNERAVADLLSPIREGLVKYDMKIEQLSRERDEPLACSRPSFSAWSKQVPT